MTIDEARRRLHDETFLLGRFRRRSAIRKLSASHDPASVTVLADGLVKGHPDAARIDATLRQLSAGGDAGKVRALWEHWARAPTIPVAVILSRLGWPSGQEAQAGTVREILAAANLEAAPEIMRAITLFARSLPAADEEINDDLCSAWVRSQSSGLGQLFIEQGRRPGSPASAILLAEALGKGHPEAARVDAVLRQLSAERDTGMVLALWEHWAQSPTEPVAAILVHLGWPAGCTATPRIMRNIFSAANPAANPETNQGAASEILKAVTVFARSLPVEDEGINDAIYGAWLRSQSDDLEQLIAEQNRQPGNTALEALHALVAGKPQRYAALDDENGHLLIQAYAMASQPLRERLAHAVAASHDRRIMAAYREALAGSGVDTAGSVGNLKRVADEDGLFESCRSLRLMQVLDLCERWAGIAARPGGASQRAAVDRAVAAYRRLQDFKPESGPVLPGGMVDIFDWWRTHEPDDAQLRSDLDAGDPFVKARGLYLGHERGIVDVSRISAAATSVHWPERLIARLADPVFCAQPSEEHVLWASACACACDGELLNAPVGGTPEEYARHTALLAAGQVDARNRGLLEILCAFQAVFVGAGITVDTSADAIHSHAIEVEDAPDEVF